MTTGNTKTIETFETLNLCKRFDDVHDLILVTQENTKSAIEDLASIATDLSRLVTQSASLSHLNYKPEEIAKIKRAYKEIARLMQAKAGTLSIALKEIEKAIGE